MGGANVTYDVTGFDDILYDYINGNPIARQVVDTNDAVAKNGTDTHSHYKDLPKDVVGRFNWLYRNDGPEAAYEYIDTVTDKDYTGIQALLYGTMKGAGTVSIAETLGSGAAFLLNDDEMKKKLSEEHVKFEQDLAGAREQHPVMATAGEVGGNLMMLSTLSSGIGTAGKALGAGKAATTFTGRAVNSAATFMAADAVRNAGAVSTGNMSPEEYGKSVAISGAQGLAGGLAEGLVNTGISTALTKSGLMTPFMEFVRQTSSGFAAASANIGTGYALREEKPTKEQMATDFVTAFLFSVIRGAISTSQTTQADKARLENSVGAIGQKYEQMAQKWQTMSPAERAAMAGDIIDQTRQLQGALNSTYIAGQQETVNQLNAALDYICTGMESYVSGIQPYQPAAGGTAVGGSAVGGAFTGLPFAGGGITSSSEVTALQNQLQTAITQGITEPAGSGLAEGVVPVRTGALPTAETATGSPDANAYKKGGAVSLQTVNTQDAGGNITPSVPGQGENTRLSREDLNDYLKTGKKKSVRDAKQAVVRSGENVILTSPWATREFIQDAISGEALGTTKAYGKVGVSLANDVYSASGGKLDIKDWYLELTPYDLKHAFSEHSEAKKAGNIPLSLENFLSIPDYIDTYDDVLNVKEYDSGDKTITLGKKINGYSVIVEMVSGNRHSIHFKNMWGLETETYEKQYKKGGIASPQTVQASSANDLTRGYRNVSATAESSQQVPGVRASGHTSKTAHANEASAFDNSIPKQIQSVNPGVFGEASLHMTPMEALQRAQNNNILQRNGGSGYGSELAEKNGTGAGIAQGGTADSGQVALPDGDPGWRSYERETRRHERVPEAVRNAGRTKENRIVSQQRREAVRAYDPVSPEELGVPFGSSAETCLALPESEWDEEIQRGVEWAYSKGIRKVTPVVGEILLEQDGRSGSVVGTINEVSGEIFVRCDTVTTSFSENLEHEVAHQMAAPKDAAAFERQVRERFGEKAWTAIFNTYRQRYSAITNGFAGMEEAEIAAYVSEEIMADAYSGADKFGAKASLYGSIADEVLEGNVLRAKLPTTAQQNGNPRLTENIPEVRGPPEELNEKQLAEEDELWNRERFAVDEENEEDIKDISFADSARSLQSIGRKSINSFTSEEITASEPFARKFYSEMGVKSPFFRAWFGDWRVNDETPVNIARVKNMKQFSAGATENKDTGVKISWGDTIRAETWTHGRKNGSIDFLRNIDDIVKNAILLDTHASSLSSKSKLNTTAFMHSFYALAEGEDRSVNLLKLFVEEAATRSGSDSFKRAYELKNIEKVDTRYGIQPQSDLSDGEVSTINTIADLFQLVKKKDPAFQPKPASAVVDENGKPLVVYHATNSQFSMFDKSLRGKNTLNNAMQWDLGATALVGDWFSDHDVSGRTGAKRTMEVFLDIKNPYETSLYELADMIGGFADNYGETQDAFDYSDYAPAREAAQEFVENLQARGYDGLIVQDQEFGGVSYVALEPEQIKSATDNTGTFDKANPDIRFSVSDESEDKQGMMQDIRSRADDREDHRYSQPINLRTYTETQAQKIVDKAHGQNMSVEKYLREHREVYSRNGSWDKEAREALKLEQKAWRFAAGGEGEAKLAEREGGANQLADQKTDEQLETEVAALQQQLREARKEMRARNGEGASPQKVEKKPIQESKPILAKRDLKRNLLSLFSIPEGRKAELGNMIDSYADRLRENGQLTQEDRDAFFDRMYEEGVMEVPADSYFQEAREAVRGRKIYVNDSVRAEFGDDWGRFARQAFNSQIYLTNDPNDAGPDVWNQELAEVLPGLFDDRETDSRAMLERIVQVAEEGKAQKMSLAEYASSLAEEGYVSEDEVLDNLERQMDWALRTYAEKASLEVHLRDRTGVKLAQERARRKESMERQRNNRELRELQQKTLKQLQWISKNQMKAPADLKQAFQDVLGDIDILAVGAANEMNWSDKYNATWKDLKEMYQAAQKNDPNFLPSPELQKIVDRLDKEKIGEMDVGALQDLYRAAVGLRTEFYNRRNVIDDDRHRLFDEVYRGSKEEIEAAGKGFRTGVAGALGKLFNYEEMTPMNVLEMMGGWDPDGTFFSMAKQLEKGERDMRDYEVRAKRMLDGFIQEHKDWIEKSDGQGKDAIWYEIEVPELMQLNMGDKPIFGDTVKVYMTPAQKVHMYLESKNYDNLRHMAGGRTFADKKLYSKGKRTEAYAQGTTVKLAPETVKKLVADPTPEEEELAKVLGEYYNTFAAEEINRVSNPLYGYDKAIGSGNYAPIYTNQNYTKSEIGIFDATAEGVGNLKARQYSKNPSYNLGAFDAFERHVKQTARFVGMAIPARNWNTLLNWREQSNSMADVITHRFGDVGKQYITDLINSLQSGGKVSEKGVVDRFTDKVLSKYVSAVFGFNPGIVFKQAASFPQFASALGWKNLSLGRVDENLINTYTSELAYRKLGYATPETALLKNHPGKLSTNKAYQFMFGGGAITAMDAFTVKRAWTWAEKKVRNEYPELETGTPEQIAAGESPFYKKVAEEWENAVSLTQPMYDEMHRANIMKGSKGVTRAFTMFKTVPLQQYNTLRRSLGELKAVKRKYGKDKIPGNERAKQRAEEKVRKASWKAAAAITATIGSILMLEAVEFLNQLWKNRGKKYRDEEGNLAFESIMERVLWDSFGDAAGMVTFGGEIADAIESKITGGKWYGIEIPGGEQLDDMIDSVSGASATIEKFVEDSFDVISNGGDWAEYVRRNAGDYLGAVKEILEKASMYLGGFPMENIEKYLMGSLPEEIRAQVESVFDTPTKSDLKGLSGGALEARTEYLFGVRNVQIDEGTAEKLSELYHAQLTDAIPADTPSKVTVGEEEKTLTAYQKQTYDRVWGGIVQDCLDSLVGSGSFQKAEPEVQAKMLKKLYSYADAKAKSVLYDDFALDKQYQNAERIIEAGGTADQWAAWTAESSGMKAEEKYLMLAEAGYPDEVKKSMVGNEIGTELKTESGEDSQYAKMLKLLESGMDMTDYLLLKAQGSGAVDKYVKFLDSGVKVDYLPGITKALDDLEEETPSEDPKAVEKYMAIAETPYPEREKESALKAKMSDSAYAKYMAARKSGVDTYTYCKFLRDTSEYSGKKKRDKVWEYINALPLSLAQKDTLHLSMYKESSLKKAPWH